MKNNVRKQINMAVGNLREKTTKKWKNKKICKDNYTTHGQSDLIHINIFITLTNKIKRFLTPKSIWMKNV